MTTFVSKGCILLRTGTPSMYRLNLYNGDADMAFGDNTTRPPRGYCLLESETGEYRIWPFYKGVTQALLEEIFSVNLSYGFEVGTVWMNDSDLDEYNSQLCIERVRTT